MWDGSFLMLRSTMTDSIVLSHNRLQRRYATYLLQESLFNQKFQSSFA